MLNSVAEARGHWYRPPGLGTQPLSNCCLLERTGEERGENPGRSDEMAGSCPAEERFPGQAGEGWGVGRVTHRCRWKLDTAQSFCGDEADDGTATGEIKLDKGAQTQAGTPGVRAAPEPNPLDIELGPLHTPGRCTLTPVSLNRVRCWFWGVSRESPVPVEMPD